MKNLPQITAFSAVAIFALSGSLTSCANHDFDWEEAYRTNPEYVFKENFEKEFGTIDPGQSWDFSNTTVRTRASVGYTVYGTDEVIMVSDEEVPSANVKSNERLSANINQKYAANSQAINSTNYTTYGDPYSYTSKGEFYVCPYWHGDCRMSDLVIVGRNPFTGEVLGAYKITAEQMNANMTQKSTDISYTTGYPNNKICDLSEARKVSFPLGTKVDFYLLDRTTNKLVPRTYVKDDGTQFIGSLKGKGTMAKTALSNVPAIYYDNILFDDLDMDQDYDDLLVFIASFGTGAPPEAEEGDISYNTKRYMIEDLGAVESSDIDFNDIVVDFVEKIKTKFNYGAGTAFIDPSANEYEFTTYANVRALGGTRNVSLHLTNADGTGDKCIFIKEPSESTFSVASGVTVAINEDYGKDADGNFETSFGAALSALDYKTMYNTKWTTTEDAEGDDYYNEDDIIATVDLGNPLQSYSYNTTTKKYEFTYKDGAWRPDLNNVFVVVESDKGNKDTKEDTMESAYSITFPSNGEVPKMIAVPLTQKWNEEKVSVFKHSVEGCNLKLKNLATTNVSAAN